MADALSLQNALNLARNVPALAATVTVVDDAGKVVTTVCPERSYMRPVIQSREFHSSDSIVPVPCCIVIVMPIFFSPSEKLSKQTSCTDLPPSPKISSVHSRRPAKPTKHAKPKSPRSVPVMLPDVARPGCARPAVTNAASANLSLLLKTSKTTTARRTRISR